MVAFGVIVSLGKPYALTTAPGASGRLNLTQASLDDDSTDQHTVSLLVTLRNKSTVVIARLLPRLSESLHLDLRFNLSEEVTFSVRGPRNVHLAGYFDCLPDSSESFGEDVARSESDEKSVGDDDEYGGSFINDSDPGFFSSSPATSSDEAKECPRNKTKKPKEGSTSRGRHRKKHTVDSSSDGSKSTGGSDTKAVVSDSDDEFEFYENSLLKRRLVSSQPKRSGEAKDEVNEQSLKAVKSEPVLPTPPQDSKDVNLEPKVTKKKMKNKKVNDGANKVTNKPASTSSVPLDEGKEVADMKCLEAGESDHDAALQINGLIKDDVMRSKKVKRKKHQANDIDGRLSASAEALLEKNKDESKKEKKRKSC